MSSDTYQSQAEPNDSHWQSGGFDGYYYPLFEQQLYGSSSTTATYSETEYYVPEVTQETEMTDLIGVLDDFIYDIGM